MQERRGYQFDFLVCVFQAFHYFFYSVIGNFKVYMFLFLLCFLILSVLDWTGMHTFSYLLMMFSQLSSSDTWNLNPRLFSCKEDLSWIRRKFILDKPWLIIWGDVTISKLKVELRDEEWELFGFSQDRTFFIRNSNTCRWVFWSLHLIPRTYSYDRSIFCGISAGYKTTTFVIYCKLNNLR
jgi:hypothetical protein